MSRFRTGRQRDRRALQAQTEMDLQHLRRFEGEVIAARAHRSKQERHLLQACATGSVTTVDALIDIESTPTLYHPAHLDGNRGPTVCLASAAIKVWDECGSNDAIRPPPGDTACAARGSPVCFATAAVKTWDGARYATTGVIDEWPVLMQPTGSTPCPSHSSHEAASVGLGQSSADDGTALVEENDQHANRSPHLKPKRNGEAQALSSDLA